MLVALIDVKQKSQPILRVFPLVGRARFLLSRLGPKLRQYVVANDNEERPYSRIDRDWVDASAQGDNTQIAFGSRTDPHNGGPTILHSTFASTGQGLTDDSESLETIRDRPLKALGTARQRRHIYQPASWVNISGMSFGSLSGPAVQGLNLGAKEFGCFQNTGEGGLSVHHQQGADLVFQIGTGYFGCRDVDGDFSLEALKETIANHPVRALEIKLSQGAKPGIGGFLPGAKVSHEISKARGVPAGVDCASPARHKAFHDVDTMLDWVEYLAAETGLPVGIKSAVGEQSFWSDLASAMEGNSRGVDFICIDGAEGGTGAAPPSFANSVGLSFARGFPLVYSEFQKRGLQDQVAFIGSGKLGLPQNAIQAFASGVDMVNIGRTALIAMGCIQALKCHTGDCPTGIAAQKGWLIRGIDPEAAGQRVELYLGSLRREIHLLTEACGVEHAGFLEPRHILDLATDHVAGGIPRFH